MWHVALYTSSRFDSKMNDYDSPSPATGSCFWGKSWDRPTVSYLPSIKQSTKYERDPHSAIGGIKTELSEQ